MNSSYIFIKRLHFNLRFFIGKYFSFFYQEWNIYHNDDISFSSFDKILILVPHYDDEILACAPIIYNAIRSGASVSLVYVSDSNLGGLNYKKLENYSLLRKAESIQALHVLDNQNKVNTFYLDIPDQKVSNNINYIVSFLNNVDFNKLYIPFKEDPHLDHSILNCVALKLERQFELFEYFVFFRYIENVREMLISKMPFDIAIKSLSFFKSQVYINFSKELISRRYNDQYCTFFRNVKM